MHNVEKISSALFQIEDVVHTIGFGLLIHQGQWQQLQVVWQQLVGYILPDSFLCIGSINFGVHNSPALLDSTLILLYTINLSIKALGTLHGSIHSIHLFQVIQLQDMALQLLKLFWSSLDIKQSITASYSGQMVDRMFILQLKLPYTILSKIVIDVLSVLHVSLWKSTATLQSITSLEEHAWQWEQHFMHMMILGFLPATYDLLWLMLSSTTDLIVNVQLTSGGKIKQLQVQSKNS